jgi:predicted adenylyl cyclase CyaB
MRNLEAKFKLADLTEARARAEQAALSYRDTLVQRDTFYRVPHGKLKLREERSGAALIHYQRREHAQGLVLSDYTIVATADSVATHAMLERALGVIAVVKKRRTLLTRDNLRLHLDEVEGLGEFGEIEIIVPEDTSAAAYDSVLRGLLDTLGVAPDVLIGESYFELIVAKSAG